MTEFQNFRRILVILSQGWGHQGSESTWSRPSQTGWHPAGTHGISHTSPAESSSRHGSHTSPVSTSDPTLGTANAVRSQSSTAPGSRSASTTTRRSSRSPPSRNGGDRWDPRNTRTRNDFLSPPTAADRTDTAPGWRKHELARLATATGGDITVSHYPPGTSTWNKIEHRLFSRITRNWRRRPLETYQTIVNLIANTTTTTGLIARADLDLNSYPTNIKLTDHQKKSTPITRPSPIPVKSACPPPPAHHAARRHARSTASHGKGLPPHHRHAHLERLRDKTLQTAR
jgi:DDE family transposase